MDGLSETGGVEVGIIQPHALQPQAANLSFSSQTSSLDMKQFPTPRGGWLVFPHSECGFRGKHSQGNPDVLCLPCVGGELCTVQQPTRLKAFLAPIRNGFGFRFTVRSSETWRSQRAICNCSLFVELSKLISTWLNGNDSGASVLV